MARKWTKDDGDGRGMPDDSFIGESAPGRYCLVQKHAPHLNKYAYIDLLDTIVCSYSRFEEIVRLMKQRPYDDRSSVIANAHVSHNTAYYVDDKGNALKFVIEDN